MDRRISAQIIAHLIREYGTPEIPLTYSNIYELTIAVILSAQTTDAQVNKVTPKLFSLFPTFEKLSSADRAVVEEIIHSTGFFRAKAGNIIKLAQTVCAGYGGRLPSDIKTLTTLPGIGRKSANVIINQGFGLPGLAVDTHVLRLSNRLGYYEGKNPDQAEMALKAKIPQEQWGIAHLLFITHGRAVCHARHAECARCVIRRYCPGKDKYL